MAHETVFVLILDMLFDKVWCTESFVTDLADILFAFNHFSGLLVTILHLGLNEKFVFLRILDLIDKTSFSEEFLCLFEIVLLKQSSGAVKGGRVKDDSLHRRRQSQMLTSTLTCELPLILTLDSQEEIVAMDLAHVE